MSRGDGVQGHTRSGADDESRTRGLGHGVAALCPLSYIRKVARRPSASTEVVPRRLLKSGHRCWWCDPSIAGLRRCAGRVERKTKKARILAESGPLRAEIRGCACLRAALSRMRSILMPIKLSEACRHDRIRDDGAWVQQLHRRGTRERDLTLHGSGGSDDVCGFHDEVSKKMLL